jgi:hypothetical protein
MIAQRRILRGVILVGFASLYPGFVVAAPVACAGGTLDFTASSDTPFTLSTFNVGQKTTFTAVASGFTPTGFGWTIPGPHIKDYNDDLGTRETPPLATPRAWSVTPLAAADLAASTVSFYWKPSAAQTHPLLGGPEPRLVSLTVTHAGGGTCTLAATFFVERNMTDPDKQPEDFYTSTHRAPTTTNPGFGRVVDEHIYWHEFVGVGPTGSWRQFLAWHGYLLRRFDEWRTEFGYEKVAPWYPGQMLPTGPAFDHPTSLRRAYVPANNRLDTWFTIAGSSNSRPNEPIGSGLPFGQRKLGDFLSLNDFSNVFEFTFHGVPHCNIGARGTSNLDFFATSGPTFGSMCKASSPKDPMFWRWHGFIDTMYRNYCRLRSISCHSGPDPASDPWMGDNADDIAAGGNVPSPAPHWLSPDIWNRRAPVTTDSCTGRLSATELNNTGGITRNCGSSSDHENPVAGAPNYLYATLRNTRSGQPRNVYAEVAVYIANASTGLSWPTDFTLLPESRQFITLQLEPGQVTGIGPLPWTPPSPSPSDHWCIYVRVLSVQETPLVEGSGVGANVASSNSIAWRNLKIVDTDDDDKGASFIVRNIQANDEPLDLQFDVTPRLLQAGPLVLRLDETLRKAAERGKARLDGLKISEGGVYAVTSPQARLSGIHLGAREYGAARVQIGIPASNVTEGEVQVTQFSSKGVDGGVTLRVADRPPSAASGADLVVESLTHSPQDPVVDERITFTAVVKNAARRRAGPSVLSFRVGGETPPGRTFSIPALDPGETHSVSRQEILGVGQNYRNTVVVDLDNQVPESNEANNEKTDDYLVSQKR